MVRLGLRLPRLAFECNREARKDKHNVAWRYPMSPLGATSGIALAAAFYRNDILSFFGLRKNPFNLGLFF